MFYILLPPPKFSQHEVDFSFSASDQLSSGTAPSPFQFITDKSHAPEGAAVIEWSDAIRRFIRQLD